MAMKYLKSSVLALSLMLLTPGIARADWLFTPYAGMTFGKDAKNLEHFNWGASAGWMGAGIVGFEVDFNHTPKFFEPKDASDTDVLFGSNNVTTLMGNVILGAPIGGQSGPGIRPYVSAGLGLLKTNVPGTSDFLEVSRNDFGFNLGFGAHVFASDHVGFRGDVRYVRSLQNEEGQFDDFKVGNFDFWRWTVGVTFR
jgi:opacity protein-like surface antigen